VRRFAVMVNVTTGFCVSGFEPEVSSDAVG
jgi:hypothetical protein